MKKVFAVIFSLMLAMFCFSGCGGDTTQTDDLSGVKNVVLLIGDGMGDSHIENAKDFFDIEQFAFEKDFKGRVTTNSLSGTTDSAAAATALATGQKAKNKEVGQHDNTEYDNIMQLAERAGMKTGIITTDKLYGATPACFSSHTDNRGNKDDIIADQIESDIDLMVGWSSGSYNAKREDFEQNGYTWATDYNDIKNLTQDQKCVGLFDNMRSKYNDNLSQRCDLEIIIKYALEFLDNQNGFCLMIENAYIDKCSHDNDYYGAVCEVREFADMINEVYNFVSGRDDTLIMVTADHETGGLRTGKFKEELGNGLFSTTGHTGINVNFYANKQVNSNKIIDNTDIFKYSKLVVDNRKLG